MLLRHWSLYESFQNSPYLITKLSLWKEPGRVEKEFLADIGISLEQAKQKYQYMSVENRKNMKQKILEKINKWNLQKII